jgi:hypothetical protein
MHLWIRYALFREGPHPAGHIACYRQHPADVTCVRQDAAGCDGTTSHVTRTPRMRHIHQVQVSYVVLQLQSPRRISMCVFFVPTLWHHRHLQVEVRERCVIDSQEPGTMHLMEAIRSIT